MGKGGYGLTYQEVYEMENLTIEAKAIYGMLCSYAGSKAMAYPSALIWVNLDRKERENEKHID